MLIFLVLTWLGHCISVDVQHLNLYDICFSDDCSNWQRYLCNCARIQISVCNCAYNNSSVQECLIFHLPYLVLYSTYRKVQEIPLMINHLSAKVNIICSGILCMHCIWFIARSFFLNVSFVWSNDVVFILCLCYFCFCGFCW